MSRLRTLSVGELTEAILIHLLTGRPCSVTWLNHSSVRTAALTTSLSRINYVGIDGKLLQRIVGATSRTSADLVLPQVLRALPAGTRLAIIGASPDQVSRAASTIRSIIPPDSEVVAAWDGYIGRPALSALPEILSVNRINLLIVGLGAGLQDDYAATAASGSSATTAITCGGWLDQVTNPTYYPSWAYPLRLNWLIRLLREPRRLWKRYTIEAMATLLCLRRVRQTVRHLEGLRRPVISDR